MVRYPEIVYSREKGIEHTTWRVFLHALLYL